MLAQGKAWAARLPVEALDLPQGEELERERSGSRMATHGIGRRGISGEPDRPRLGTAGRGLSTLHPAAGPSALSGLPGRRFGSGETSPASRLVKRPAGGAVADADTP